MMIDETQPPSPEEQLVEFMFSGQAILEETASQIRQMPEEERKVLVGVVMERIETDNAENEGVKQRAEWIRRLGGEAASSMLERMKEATLVASHARYIPPTGRHSNPRGGRQRSDPSN